MPADPRDDFGIFEDHEHMFFGIGDPFAMIREETTNILQQQVPGTEIESIQCHGEPNWLTLGRKIPDDPQHIVLGHFAFCFRCKLSVAAPGGAEVLDATMTFMFGDMDKPGEQKMRVDMALHADAAAAITPDAFQQRFLEFREGFE